MWIIQLVLLPVCFSFINKNGINLSKTAKLVRTITNKADENGNYLDKDNLQNLEKIFNLKNRRYSPYNKNVYKRQINKINHNITDNESFIISKKPEEFIQEIAKTIEDQKK